MNKKQKAIVIIWALGTACLGLLGVSVAETKNGLTETIVLWVTLTSVAGAFWWVFASKKPE